MSRFSIFKRKPESPAEKQALANLDEVTREVAGQEGLKEEEREAAGLGLGPFMFSPDVPRVPFHHVPGDPVPEPVDDPDPASPGGLRDALREGAEERPKQA